MPSRVACPVCLKMYVPKRKDNRSCSSECTMCMHRESKRKGPWKKRRLCKSCNRGFIANKWNQECCTHRCSVKWQDKKRRNKNNDDQIRKKREGVLRNNRVDGNFLYA